MKEPTFSNQPNQDESPGQAMDERWYGRLEEWGSFHDVSYLDGDASLREQEKKKFLSGEVENPTLDYPRLDIGMLREREQQLLALKNDILKQEKNEVLKQGYQWKLNEKIAELRLLLSTASGDMRRFKKYSSFVHGRPSEEIFAFSVQNIRNWLTKHLDSENPDLKKAARELDGVLPSDLPQPKAISLPDRSTVQFAQEKTEEEFSDIINIPEQEKFTPQEILGLFDDSLESIGAKQLGWEAVESEGGIYKVDQEKLKAKVPGFLSKTRNAARALLVHEIGTHVKRRINGQRSRLKLLGLGLDRYIPGEEGVSTVREQALAGKAATFAGVFGHLAIGLARGVDGQERNFRDVYSILEKYYRFIYLARGKSLEDADEFAQRDAWFRCERTFRGSDCATPGACLTKDIAYREGNINVWRVIGEKPGEIMKFSMGKFDPSNERHVWILEQLGITDQDLKI